MLSGPIVSVLPFSQLASLNAPFGARCFLAGHGGGSGGRSRRVLMHLLALGAFWLEIRLCIGMHLTVLMHLLALGAFWLSYRSRKIERDNHGLNAPFGARCFLAHHGSCRGIRPTHRVLMHLLALGAFWLTSAVQTASSVLIGLNAPFGARCFLAGFPHPPFAIT